MYKNLAESLRYCAKNGDCRNCPAEWDCAGTFGDGLYIKAAEAIEELSKPRWIPVTERLPEKHHWCLVVGENLYDMDFINSRGVWTMHDKPYAPIDYWMPLPEPPEAAT